MCPLKYTCFKTKYSCTWSNAPVEKPWEMKVGDLILAAALLPT